MAGLRFANLESVKELIGAATLALLAGIALTLASRWGIGISPDSVAYLNFAGEPRTHAPGFAPMYAWLMSLISALGIDVLTAAKWLNVSLLIANVLLAWYVLYRGTESRAASFLGAFLILTCPDVLKVYGTAQSEPLFILCLLLAWLLLARYLETESPWFLLGSAGATAVGILTRYAGAPMAVVGLLVIVLFGPKATRKRFLDSAIFGVVSCLPLVVFLFFQRIQAGLGRELAFLGNPDTERFIGGVLDLAQLILPSAVPFSLRMLVLIVVIGTLAVLTASYIRMDVQRLQAIRRTPVFATLPHVLGPFIIFYTAFLVLSVFIEADMSLYSRYLMPIYIAAVLLSVLLVQNTVTSSHSSRIFYTAVVVFAIGLASLNTARATKWIVASYQEGSGFTSVAWHTSELIGRIRTLEPSIPIYTNGYDAVVYLTGRRNAHMIPGKSDRRSGKVNSAYLDQVEAMRADLRENNGILVYFSTIDWRFYLPSEAELKSQLPLKVVVSAPDGTIYKVE